jgi:hypothetical protein
VPKSKILQSALVVHLEASIWKHSTSSSATIAYPSVFLLSLSSSKLEQLHNEIDKAAKAQDQ